MNDAATCLNASCAGLLIRPAVVADADVLCAAERETARIPGRLLSQPQELHAAAFAQKIAELAAVGSYLVAERDGVVVAHGVLEPAGNLAALAHVRTLTIVVHPGYTAQGIGTTLLQALLNWAQNAAGVRRVELRVREGNLVAMQLYKKCGFIEESRFRRRVSLPDGTLLDDIGMTWFTSPADGVGR